ncbi:hypothetical protein PR202_gb00658 [Eleusine coracana subsp. coracana]|uniref:Disease resistance R13L4/SHOC-2-like LRR domain-containing protein n=1 Tax=Eleusine coracana subsp. coracana TaxID=191504 RepID=A0AAV5DUV4_ELECO|nr:hypothetical protein PR202_gb00658 [Eleusine coracana subsp. coracana]
MPMLRSLEFEFHEQKEREILSSDGDFDMGLGNLPSLQDVKVQFDSRFDSRDKVDEATIMLSHATRIHPNHPTFKIYSFGDSDDESSCRDQDEGDVRTWTVDVKAIRKVTVSRLDRSLAAATNWGCTVMVKPEAAVVVVVTG